MWLLKGDGGSRIHMLPSSVGPCEEAHVGEKAHVHVHNKPAPPKTRVQWSNLLKDVNIRL